MPGYEYRQAEQVQDVQPETPTVQGEGGSNAERAESLGMSAEEEWAIEDVWAWMNEEDGEQVHDPCAPSPIFPLDPAQREAQGLPPSGMPGEECVVPTMQADEFGPPSPAVADEIEAEREAAERGTPRGRSRGGGGDSIRWRTKDPNHPSPYAPPMAQGAPLMNPPSHTAPMR